MKRKQRTVLLSPKHYCPHIHSVFRILHQPHLSTFGDWIKKNFYTALFFASIIFLNKLDKWKPSVQYFRLEKYTLFPNTFSN